MLQPNQVEQRAVLEPQDFANLRRIVRRAVELEKELSFDDAQVLVLLDSKLGAIMGQQQQAAMEAAVKQEVTKREAQAQQEKLQSNDVPSAH